MSIKLKNTLVSAMSAMSGPQLGSINVIGSGGPFDVLEGTTSMLVTVDKTSVLIDCGPQIYSRMRERNIGMDVSSIIITSSDESSIGSLATLVSRGRLDLTRSISEIVPLEDVAEGIAKLDRAEGNPIRILVQP